MASDEWFFENASGHAVGPFTSKQLKRLAERGEIGARTRLRSGDHGSWVVAARYKGLRAIFAEQAADSGEHASADSDSDQLADERRVDEQLADDKVVAMLGSGSRATRAVDSDWVELEEDEEWDDHGEDDSDEESYEWDLPETGAGISELFGSRGRQLLSDLKQDLVPRNQVPQDIRCLITSDEQLVFAGNPSKQVRQIQMFMVTVFNPILYLAVAWAIGTLGDGSDHSLVDWLFLAMLLVVALGYMKLMHYLIQMHWRKQFYAITTKRVLACRGWFDRKIVSALIRSVPVVHVDTGTLDRWIGTSTVVFSAGFSKAVVVFRHVEMTRVILALHKVQGT